MVTEGTRIWLYQQLTMAFNTSSNTCSIHAQEKLLRPCGTAAVALKPVEVPKKALACMLAKVKLARLLSIRQTQLLSCMVLRRVWKLKNVAFLRSIKLMLTTLELHALLEACLLPQTERLPALLAIQSHSNECNQLRSQDSKDDFSMKEQLATAQTELTKP